MNVSVSSRKILNLLKMHAQRRKDQILSVTIYCREQCIRGYCVRNLPMNIKVKVIGFGFPFNPLHVNQRKG